VRAHIAEHGMRNSNCLAIAPPRRSATSSASASASSPTYQNLFGNRTCPASSTVVNMYLVDEAEEARPVGPPDVRRPEILRGSVQKIARVPDHLKALFATAFEIEPKWLIEAAAAAKKWIDQASR